MKEILLSGRSIAKAFGTNTVPHGIDAKLCAGDFTVIMGSSGCGKSAPLYAPSGRDRVSGGQLRFCFKDAAGANIAAPIGCCAETEGLTDAVIEAYQSNFDGQWVWTCIL